GVCREHYAFPNIRRQACQEIHLQRRMQVQFRFINEKDRWASNRNIPEHHDELCQAATEFAEPVGLSVDNGLQRPWIVRSVNLKATVVKDVSYIVSDCLD